MPVVLGELHRLSERHIFGGEFGGYRPSEHMLELYLAVALAAEKSSEEIRVELRLFSKSRDYIVEVKNTGSHWGRREGRQK